MLNNSVNMREIYLDHAAATPLDPRVKAAMEPYWSDAYGNASALYRQGRLAKDAVDESRRTVARGLRCKPDEIIFSAGSTEADNIAIFGAAGMFRGHSFDLSTTLRAGAAQGRGHLITTAFEHHAGLRAFESLERGSRTSSDGTIRDKWEVTYLPVNGEG